MAVVPQARPRRGPLLRHLTPYILVLPVLLYYLAFWARPVAAVFLASVRDPVVDALVDQIVYAATSRELTTVCHALDRVLWYGYYVVPNWYLAYHRLAYASRFGQPEQLPLYYTPFQFLMTWWANSAR